MPSRYLNTEDVSGFFCLVCFLFALMGGYHYIYKQKIQLFVLLRSYASSSQIRHQAKHSALLSKVIFGDED